MVIGEYDRNESSPSFELQQKIGKALYPGQWSRKNIIGDREVIQTRDAGEDARRFSSSTTSRTTRRSSSPAT